VAVDANLATLHFDVAFDEIQMNIKFLGIGRDDRLEFLKRQWR
jgi:hypothetical protein